MKIFIAADGKTRDSNIAERFARCPVLMGYDTEKEEIIEAVDNPYKDGTGGVGVQVSNYIAQKGYEAAIGPHTGPNATGALTEAGVKLFTFQGSIKDAIAEFLKSLES